MLMATDYPPEIGNVLQPPEIIVMHAKEVCNYLATLQNTDTTST
jgi:hypothetical protein